jgi:hypothetical protein
MFSLQGSFCVSETAGGQVINESSHVIVQLIFCDGFIDDCLKMWWPVAWPKRKDKPDDEIVFGVAP